MVYIAARVALVQTFCMLDLHFSDLAGVSLEIAIHKLPNVVILFNSYMASALLSRQRMPNLIVKSIYILASLVRRYLDCSVILHSLLVT
jgi:hypothetical protein